MRSSRDIYNVSDDVIQDGLVNFLVEYPTRTICGPTLAHSIDRVVLHDEMVVA